MAGELVKVTSLEKDIADEVAVRLAFQVYVWEGTTGVFRTSDEFVAFKEQFDCLQQTVEGVELAVMTAAVPVPNWKEVFEQRAKDIKPLEDYFKKVVRFRRDEKRIFESYLMTYWEKGKFVSALLKEPKKYGNKSAKNFAADLGVGETSVYQYKNFCEQWTPERVADMGGKKITWKAVTQLMLVKDTAERTKIENAYMAEKIDDKQMLAAIKKATKEGIKAKEKSGEKVDRRGGQQLGGVFKSVAQLSDRLQERLSDFTEGYKVYLKLPPEKTKGTELTQQYKAASNSLIHLQKRLAKLVGEPKEPKSTAETK